MRNNVDKKQTKPNRTYMRKPLRRAMIIKAAKPIFAKKGFHRTTIEDICKACNIVQGTLYLHFKNKHEIFRALVVDLLDHIQDLIKPVYPDDQDVPAGSNNEFFEFVKQKNMQIFRAVNKDRDLFRILMREAPGLNSEIDEILTRINNVMLGQIEAEFIIGQRLGMIRQVDARLGASMALGTMFMVILTHFSVDNEPPDIEHLAEKVTELQFFGIQKPAFSQ
jgi:AcrR family transcriptional regulator